MFTFEIVICRNHAIKSKDSWQRTDITRPGQNYPLITLGQNYPKESHIYRTPKQRFSNLIYGQFNQYNVHKGHKKDKLTDKYKFLIYGQFNQYNVQERTQKGQTNR